MLDVVGTSLRALYKLPHLINIHNHKWDRYYFQPLLLAGETDLESLNDLLMVTVYQGLKLCALSFC